VPRPGLRHRLRGLLRRAGLVRGPRKRKPRAAAVVVDGDRVLLMKRHRDGRDYAVLPGGGVEEGETPAEAVLRELHEETTLTAAIERVLGSGWHGERPVTYFLMTDVRGTAVLSGPELAKHRPDNRFELVWVTADRFAELGLHPPDVGPLLTELLAAPR
jgi:8-oxo-dGTP pyrophosphatase MutT (NUDIX family)